ncbi:response regulator [Heliorestis acidaminivorans]|uniref:Stage 0 sporulation protein A homolog n=1 Tax=Heliorestis acidaminivorans TaxID=553427 RepID=A0A6I0FAZ3_9FIRM|nr:response regulator [Heliorestis acidaminivorans]KAB2954648.1 response regulator [Heliorestis acidaminivorans]
MVKVLIVDDALFIRKTIKMHIEKNGFQVVGEAENGFEAVSKYLECQPDLVTMDITMPNTNGIESLKKIMSLDPNAKVVMVSAIGQETYIRKAILNGAKSFIVKPFTEEVIVRTLSRVSDL